MAKRESKGCSNIIYCDLSSTLTGSKSGDRRQGKDDEENE
jgi:hypothetical protein